jgi:hypothetical protein
MEEVAIEGTATVARESCLSWNYRAFRMKFVQVLLECGIIFNKVNIPLRIYIEGITQIPLDSAQNLKPAYVKKLLGIEEN